METRCLLAYSLHIVHQCIYDSNSCNMLKINFLLACNSLTDEELTEFRQESTEGNPDQFTTLCIAPNDIMVTR